MRKANLLLILLFLSSGLFAQNKDKLQYKANKLMRNGNNNYKNAAFAEAEVNYKKSIATLPNQPETIYNLANTMMQQKRYKEAMKQYDYLAKNAKSKSLKTQSYHNLGNAFMGINDYAKAVEAYKNALRINPKDEETRYNLALAQEMLKNNQDKNKNNQDKNQQNKDKKDKQDQQNKNNQNKNQKNEQNKDQKNQNQNKKKQDNKQDKKDQENKDSQDNAKNKEQDNPQDDKQKEANEPKPKDQNPDQQKAPKPKTGSISPQQLKQLLEALQNEENKTQKKINAKKMKGKPVKSEKDW